MAVQSKDDAEYMKRLARARAALGSFDSGGTGGRILAELRHRDHSPAHPPAGRKGASYGQGAKGRSRKGSQ